MSQPATKPHLSLSKILQMNLGFLGLQFSFGLQQGNMVPIYSYLGADEASLPILQLAGPMTGLLVQPIIGVMSDRTGARQAAGASRLRWARGRAFGPLDGVPVTLKDNLHAAGLPTTWGSQLLQGFVARADELPVARLRAAAAAHPLPHATPQE